MRLVQRNFRDAAHSPTSVCIRFLLSARSVSRKHRTRMATARNQSASWSSPSGIPGQPAVTKDVFEESANGQAWVHGEHAPDHGTARSSRAGEPTNGRSKAQCQNHEACSCRPESTTCLSSRSLGAGSFQLAISLFCTAQVEQYKKKFDFFDEEPTVRTLL